MTTAVSTTHRDQLIEWLRNGNQYQFLNAVASYLYAVPDDDELRLIAAREYLNLQLIEPARELLADFSTLSKAAPEVAKLCETLAELPTDSVPWQERSDVFEANLATLADRGIEVAHLRDSWKLSRESYRLFTDGHNIIQTQRRSCDGRWHWLPMLSHHQALAEAEQLPDDNNTGFPGPYLFDGVGLGYFFERLYNKTKHSFLNYSCALYVVEPDPALFALTLHLHDWNDLLKDHRVQIFIGSDCSQQLYQAWQTNDNLPLPTTVLSLSLFRPSPTPAPMEVVTKMANERDVKVQASYESLKQQYANRDLRYWANRFREATTGTGEPLRIVAAVSMHTTFLQYSMRDTQRAFEAKGHQCVVLMEDRPFEVIGPLAYHDTIRKFDPDLFFNIDHLRASFGFNLPKNLPLLTWDQDQLPQVFNQKSLASVEPHDFVVGCSKNQFTSLGGQSDQFATTWVPTCVQQFSGEPLRDDEIEKYTCDVSYVSHASQTPQAFHEQERAQCDNTQDRELLDGLYEAMPEALTRYRTPSGRCCATLLDKALAKRNLVISDQAMRERLLSWYLWRLGDRMFRHEALEWVAAWATRTGHSFRIYGNGWDKHPSLSTYASGPAQNGRELLCIHRASRINLQLMPAGFIHQRALDGLVSGGFFLTRHVPFDQRGRLLNRLMTRMDELAIDTTQQLRACQDPQLVALLSAYHGETWQASDSSTLDTAKCLRIAAELRYPDEVFPGFEQIVFDNSQEFAKLAEYYLADQEARRQISGTMRQVVVEQFSYQPIISQFLQKMTSYLQSKVCSQ